MVNKDMAYCDECAAILHLGESRESRMFRNFHDQDGANPDAVAAVSGADSAEAPSEPDYAGVALEDGGVLEE